LRFAIVGAGAIGCLFGARLTLAGNDVTLIHRDSAVVQSIQKHGILLQETTNKSRTVPVQIRKGPVKMPDLDVFVVTVKAYDTRSVAASYRGKIDADSTVLSLQNGLGNVELLRSYLKRPLLAGSTTEGALSLGPGKIVHTGKGSTIIGSPKKDLSEISSGIKKAFDDAGFRTTRHSNIRGVLWTKAIVNAAINPLTALARVSNGALSKNSAIAELGSQVISEGIAVSRAEQIRLVGDPRRLWRKILELTPGNKSSMLQDIEKGKMTEIRQLNGAIVSHARKVGVRVPVNEILTKLVLGLESSAVHEAQSA
jgi:2-dehydropantoate 2-reductase